MADETHKRSGLRWAIILAALLPLVYVLSLGPASYVVTRRGKGMHGVRTAYAPLFWVYQRFTLVRSPLEWYVDFWEDMAARHNER
jgi:hypothetical protein